ncbi:MAG: ATP-binding protein [Bryobacteraceae bacterium]
MSGFSPGSSIRMEAAPADSTVSSETGQHAGDDSRRWLALVDDDGTIHALDGTARAGNGFSGGIELGASYFRFLSTLCGPHVERAVAVRAGVRAVAAGRDESFAIEFPHGSNGTRLRVTASRYRDGGSEYVLLTHTEVGQARVDEPTSEDPRSHKMEALGRLTSGVAHDFANLLTLISGYSEILLNRLPDRDPLRAELEEIRKAANRGAGVTAQILDFIRRQAPQPKALNLNAIVTDMEKLLRPIIGEHIAIETLLSADLGNVKADSEQIGRVIMNLVLNARDAMPGGGRITIRTANIDLADARAELTPGRYVTLSMTDTGHGMDEATSGRVFQPFFTTKKAGSGTGLGLSTVYGIVKDAHGDIWVDSTPGKGTTFTVCLPRAGDAFGGLDSIPLVRQSRAGSETILLAEDEESVRKLMKHLLTARGYTVLDAVNGLEALNLFELEPDRIDLLLTDMVMPGMTGRDLAQKVLERKPNLRVIYMSGYTDDMLTSTGALGPGMSFLRKPLRPDVLLSRIREVLDAPLPA